MKSLKLFWHIDLSMHRETIDRSVFWVMVKLWRVCIRKLRRWRTVFELWPPRLWSPSCYPLYQRFSNCGICQRANFLLSRESFKNRDYICRIFMIEISWISIDNITYKYSIYFFMYFAHCTQFFYLFIIARLEFYNCRLLFACMHCGVADNSSGLLYKRRGLTRHKGCAKSSWVVTDASWFTIKRHNKSSDCG